MINSKENKVILAQPWGGLGDNLQYSNLPKLFNDIGKKFYVSHANHVRNKNIYKFCWQSNPYSNGKIFKKPNIGWKVWIDNLNTFKDRSDCNIIQIVNLMHGFNEGDGYPSLFINKEIINNKIKFKYLADFNAISGVPDDESWQEIYKEISNYSISSLTFPSVKKLSNYPKYFKFNDEINSISIDDLIEVLSQTDTFICLNSGSHVLAAGLKNLIGRPNKIISFYPGAEDIDKPHGRYMFNNVEYFSVGGGFKPKPIKDTKLDIYEKIYLKYF